MDNLLKMMKKLIRKNRENWSLTDKYVDVQLGKSMRHQRVYLYFQGGFYFFKSVVMGSTAVRKNKRRWNELVLMAWQRNADHEIVNFGFDKQDRLIGLIRHPAEQDRLIGLIRHPAEHLDPEELELYITTLTRECDRFEYLLAGKDKF
jgi:hypothetical protein